MSLVSRVLKRGKSRRSFEEEFPYRADDVVLASYPKSGSTWLRFLLASLLAQNKAVDFLSAQLSVPEISASAAEQGVNFEELASPRFLRTHAEFVFECPRVVYMLRDGRDVMVSYFYHYRKFHDFKGTFLDFIESDRRPSEWDEHVDAWLFNNPSLDRVCVIRYEALLADTLVELKKVLDFAGAVRSDVELHRAIEECTLQNMKKIEETKGLGYVAAGKPEIPFVREGRRGGWREAFGELEKGLFKERYGTMLIKCGYESSLRW